MPPSAYVITSAALPIGAACVQKAALEVTTDIDRHQAVKRRFTRVSSFWFFDPYSMETVPYRISIR